MVGQPVKIHGVLLSRTEALVKGTFNLKVEAIAAIGQYGRFMDHKTGRLVWKRSIARNTEGVSQIKVKDGRFELHLTPTTDADEFIIRVQHEGDTTELNLNQANRVYDWDGWGPDATSATIRGPHRPDGVKIEAPSQVTVGQRVPIHFRSPYKGRALVAVETDRVLSSKWVSAKAGLNTSHIRVGTFEPNVYVTVLILKDPHAESKETSTCLQRSPAERAP